MMRTILVLAVAASGLVLSVAGSAQTSPPANPAAVKSPPVLPLPTSGGSGASVQAGEIPANGRPITLEAGKGTLIRLSRPAKSVFIVNTAIADVQVESPQLIYLTAKAPGDTALYAVDAEDHVLLNSPVRIEPSMAPVRRLKQTLHELAPNESVSVKSIDNSLVLSGKVPSAGDAERLRSIAASIAQDTKGTVVNRLSVATPNQVNIRVKVAEVNRNVLKELGINWSKIGQHVNFATNNMPDLTANTLSFALGGSSSRITGLLDILGTEGLVTTLAEPNLTATNGQPASFLAGGEFPVPIAQAGTGTAAPTITVEFKKFGVSLDVTPTIIDPEHLNLRIRTVVSQLSTQGAVTVSGFNIPALTERSAETTVELGSGQSFLLGGLLQATSTENISKVPGLGDIPIIGQLFRSEQFQRGETELVIVVTPYLVKPTLTSLATPIEGYSAPHDAQMLLYGSTYRQKLPSPAKGPLESGGQGLIGPVGFRLD